MICMNTLQDWTIDVGKRAFGDASVNDPQERLLRFAEEAFELMQAGGLTFSEVLGMQQYVYNRPVGEIKQEIGGVANCLFGLCHAHDLTLAKVAGDETFRVASNIETIRAKNAGKPARVRSAKLQQEMGDVA